LCAKDGSRAPNMFDYLRDWKAGNGFQPVDVPAIVLPPGSTPPMYGTLLLIQTMVGLRIAHDEEDERVPVPLSLLVNEGICRDRWHAKRVLTKLKAVPAIEFAGTLEPVKGRKHAMRLYRLVPPTDAPPASVDKSKQEG
jgi:hypothetical protein